MSDERKFCIIVGNDIIARCKGNTVSSAAKKSGGKLMRRNISSPFYIKETTRNSKKKIYGPYVNVGKQIKLLKNMDGGFTFTNPFKKTDSETTLQKNSLINKFKAQFLEQKLPKNKYNMIFTKNNFDYILNLYKEKLSKLQNYDDVIKSLVPKYEETGNRSVARLKIQLKESPMTIQQKQNKINNKIMKISGPLPISFYIEFKDRFGKNQIRLAAANQLLKYWDNLPNTFSYSDITLTSYNIENEILMDTSKCQKKNNGNSIDIFKCGFSKGTIFLYKPPTFEDFNFEQILVNAFKIEYKVNDKKILSFRYGTPFSPVKKLELKMDSSKLAKINDNFYIQQCETIKCFMSKQAENTRFFIISLVDFIAGIKSFNQLKYTGKSQEYEIIRSEINAYKDSENIFYMNASINSNVRLLSRLSSLKEAQKENYAILSQSMEKLKNWMDKFDGDAEIKILLRVLSKDFQYFKESILDNKIPENKEYKNYFNGKKVKVFNDNKEVHFELCRFAMFCYISLIFYLFSIGANEKYMLLYHCKSGQDRTGTFYAINQMVNEITKNKYVEIKSKLLNELSTVNCPFLAIFKLYFSFDGTNQEEYYNLCAKHLLLSYGITFSSTGFPGIKWSLGRSGLGISTENRFGYIMLKKPEDAFEYEGASMVRGE